MSGRILTLAAIALALLLGACAARPPVLPDDLTFRSIRIVEARAHPIYANWTKAPPLTQLIEIDFSSGEDFIAYASYAALPFIRVDLYRCNAEQNYDLVLRPFGGHVFWDNVALDNLTVITPDDAELRGLREHGPPYFYRSFLQIAATGAPAYDLLRQPEGLCLQLGFTDLKGPPQRSNLLFIPQDTLTAAFLAGDLTPGTDYRGPKLP
jgi:hypothetical protein